MGNLEKLGKFITSPYTTLKWTEWKFVFLRTSKKGQNLANIVLDYSQNFMEQYLIYSDLKKDTEGGIESEKTSALTYYEEYAKLNQKRYHDVIYRIQMLTYVFYKSLHNNMVNQAKLVLEIINLTFAKLYALLEWFDLYRKRLLSSTKDKLYLTKDKIDLYKEYLDVLSKQFTVQDGRSLYHVHVSWTRNPVKTAWLFRGLICFFLFSSLWKTGQK